MRASTRWGPLDLVVVQPTPFCNIRCDYCYLPERDSKARISDAVLIALFDQLFASGLCSDRFTVSWHAGEPLVLPRSFYEHAANLIQERNHSQRRITFNIQTNGTLLDDTWCEFILKQGIRVGLSLDGPAFLHDRHRRARNRRGTHDRVMKAVRRLQDHQIPFHVIAVVTRETLRHPSAFIEFFLSEGITHLALNLEEIEGAHRRSSLDYADVQSDYRHLLTEVAAAMRGNPGLRIREFTTMKNRILQQKDFQSSLYRPFHNLTVDCRGDFTVFAPELLGAVHPELGRLDLGNVTTDTFEAVLESERFEAIWREMQAGLRACRSQCAYYGICGGNSPSNKLYENGTFASTETLDCRLNQQVVADVVLAELEDEIRRQAC